MISIFFGPFNKNKRLVINHKTEIRNLDKDYLVDGNNMLKSDLDEYLHKYRNTNIEIIVNRNTSTEIKDMLKGKQSFYLGVE